MNQKHLHIICDELQAELEVIDVKEIDGSRGGSLLWRITADHGSYVIKQLSPDIDVKNKKIIKKYELSETIASQFLMQGVPAVPALKINGRHLFILEDTGYLVYPWIEGQALNRDKVSKNHISKIAEITASIHQINIDIPEAGVPRFDLYTNDHIFGIIDKCFSLNCPFAPMLKENRATLSSANTGYQAAIPFLKEDTVITHGDLDPMNVLWNNNEFFIIDWESVRRINRTRDIVRTALSWSCCFSEEDTALKMYSYMLHRYAESGGMINMSHVDAALRGTFGSYMHWLLYNIDKFCTSNNMEEKNSALDQINAVIPGIIKFEMTIPELIKISAV